MSSRTAIAIVSAAAAVAVVSPASGSAVARPVVASPAVRTSIVEPIVERLLLADTVARSKWVTRAPTDDPGREREVLDAAVREAPPGILSARVRVVVRDQIEASKTVQRALFAGWRAVPRTAPRVDPDLTAVRTQITDLTSEIVAGLAARRSITGGASCVAGLASTTSRTVTDRELDVVHVAALIQAERSICPL